MTSPEALNVLVADDDPTLRKLLATLLRRRGYETTEAVDGEQAIEILQSQKFECGSSKFDLVVLDLMMPKKSGWDVLDFIENELETLRDHVLVISAAGEDRLSELEGRGCGVIPKPFGTSDFYGSVERHMRHT